MRLFQNRSGALASTLAFLAAAAIPVAAQTPPTTATCTTAPTSVTSLSLESVLTLNNVLSTYTPSLPANTLAAISSGAAEIRARTIFNSTLNTLTVTVFTVAPGSPSPTPILTDITGTTVLTYTLAVSNTLFSCKPVPSLLFVGTLSSASGAFGSLQGAPAAVSLGYTTDSPAKVNNMVILVAGSVVGYSASATDVSLTFPAAPVTAPGTGNPPVITLTPSVQSGGTLQAFQNPFYIDASASKDPTGSALTYSWSSNPPANFVPNPPNSAAETIYFGSGAGNYTITLTVTNSAGVSTTQSFIITYISK